MKKLTLKVMNDYCKAHEVEDVTLQLAEECELKVTPSLSLQERLIFIDRVVSFCVTETGEYLPEYFDLIFWTTVFQMMSNMPMPKTKDKNTGEESVDLSVMAKWIDVLNLPCMCLKNNMINDLLADCCRKINARCEYLRSLTGSMGMLQAQVSDFVDKMQNVEVSNGEILKQVDAARQLSAVYGDNIVELNRDDVDDELGE